MRRMTMLFVIFFQATLAFCQDEPKYITTITKGDTVLIEIPEILADKKYVMVETMPQPVFNGDLSEYLNEKIRSDYRSDNYVEGVVEIYCSIDKNGYIVDPILMKGLTKEQNQIALQIVKDMPKWIPAQLYGKAISMPMLILVPFK